VLSGDKEAYGALVAHHSRSVFRVAYRITGNEATPMKWCRMRSMRGYRKLESFESRSNFGTWIYRIAVRCALDKVSRRGNASNRASTGTETESEASAVPDRAPDPEALLLSGEIGAFRESAMHSLTRWSEQRSLCGTWRIAQWRRLRLLLRSPPMRPSRPSIARFTNCGTDSHF